jgi:hypothetical protein
MKSGYKINFVTTHFLQLAASGLTSQQMLFLQDLLPHRLSNGVVADIIAKDYPGQTFWGSGCVSVTLVY